MKFFWYFLPFSLGIIGVLQAAVNKNVAKLWGVPGAVLFNSMVLLPIALISWWFFGKSSADQGFDFSVFRWWFLIPGVFGFLLVTLFPIAMTNLGALNVFVGAVAAQMLMSFIWDWKVEGVEFSWIRLSAALMSVFAAILSRLA